MINIFNQNYEELGSLDKNLVLQTQGKVKIQYGKKFIDLLNNNGELNVEVPEIFKKVSSKNEITSDGIYTIDDKVYINANGVLIELSPSGEETFYVSFITEQNASDEQKKQAQKNIGITFDSLSDAHKNITNGIVFINDSIYYIDEESESLLSLTTPLQQINNAGLSDPYDGAILQFKDGYWRYSNLPEVSINSSGELELNSPLSEINDSGLEYPENGRKILIWDNGTWKYVDLPSSGTTLNEPLAGINSAALGAHGDEDTAIVWDGSKWTFKKIGQSTKEVDLQLVIPQNPDPKKLELIYYGKENNIETSDLTLLFSTEAYELINLNPIKYFSNNRIHRWIEIKNNNTGSDKTITIRAQYGTVYKDLNLKLISSNVKLFLTLDKDVIPATETSEGDLDLKLKCWATGHYEIRRLNPDNTYTFICEYDSITTDIPIKISDKDSIINSIIKEESDQSKILNLTFKPKGPREPSSTVLFEAQLGNITVQKSVVQGEGIIRLPEFDFMKFHYTWQSQSQQDLDQGIRTLNTGIKINGFNLDEMFAGYSYLGETMMSPTLATPLKYKVFIDKTEVYYKDNNVEHEIGMGETFGNYKIPFTYQYPMGSRTIYPEGYSLAQYIIYGGDSDNGREETIINMKKIIEDLPSSSDVKSNYIYIYFYAKWLRSDYQTKNFKLYYTLHEHDSQIENGHFLKDYNSYTFTPVNINDVSSEYEHEQEYDTTESGSMNETNPGEPIATLRYNIDEGYGELLKGKIETEAEVKQNIDSIEWV